MTIFSYRYHNCTQSANKSSAGQATRLVDYPEFERLFEASKAAFRADDANETLNAASALHSFLQTHPQKEYDGFRKYATKTLSLAHGIVVSSAMLRCFQSFRRAK